MCSTVCSTLRTPDPMLIIPHAMFCAACFILHETRLCYASLCYAIPYRDVYLITITY